MSFFARNRRAKTLILAVFIILAVLLLGSSHTSYNSDNSSTIIKLNPDALDEEQLHSNSNNKHQLGQGALQTSSPEDSDNLKNLYLDPKQQGKIQGGSTGNLKSSKDPKDSSQNVSKEEVGDSADDSAIAGSGSGSSSDFENKVAASSDDNDERTIPLTSHQSPSEEALQKIKSEDVIKGDITFQNYFTSIFELMRKNQLSYPLEERMVLKDGKPFIENVLFFAQTFDRLSEWDCSEFMKFPPQFVSDLTLKHDAVVNGLPNTDPKFYSGDGYVIVGGGKYSWFALLGIETLRKVGSTLPVEVILPDEADYEFEYCDQILPSLNARCVEMTRVFGKDTLKKFQVSGYQYKAFALLASSFENAFLLDSDTFPVNNPDPLFTSELYKDYKMITWPDFWRRTTSPLFYQITNQKVGPAQTRHLNDFFTDPKYYRVESEEDIIYSIPFHDREGTIPDWTTESGEMLINKKLHFKTLLLSLYYNFDGPYGYYPLLSQGGAGEGDKETFVAAAHYYGLPYYSVYKMADRAYGWYNKEHNYEHSSIVQYDPLVDYENLQQVKKNIENAIEAEGENFKYDYDKFFTDYFQPGNSKQLFYHVHDPKMDPFQIVEKRFTFDLDGNKIRNLGEEFGSFNFDLEGFIWNVINHYVCEKKIEFKHFEFANWGTLCDEFMAQQLEFLDTSAQKIFAGQTLGQWDRLNANNQNNEE